MTHQCTRSHPHENMDAICELKTEIARLTNKLTQANQDNTDLDALCQDLQEMTYTQAMRIAELEAKLAEAEKHSATHGEPVAYLLRRQDRSGYETGEKTDYGAFPVYTASQQHTWVGLTIEEISDEFYKYESAGAWYQFACAIEAKLREKNSL